MSRRRGHLPGLDGVRGLAVLAVVGFHAGIAWLPGGFLGVDAFFVLSGFLITTLLLREWQASGRVDLRAFWGRRLRRLLPALLLVLVVVLATAPLLDPATRTGLPADVLAALGYVANWRFAFSGAGYFAQTAPPSPLQHTWSLGVEEQFYLLWPLLLVAVLRRGSRPALLAVALGGAVLAALDSALRYSPVRDVSVLYYGTDVRAQQLLVGVALAALLAPRLAPAPGRTSAAALGAPAERSLALGGLVGAIVLAVAMVTLSGTSGWYYQGGALGLAVAVAVVLAAAVLAPGRGISRLLHLRPLRALGVISYGVYLWHWPLQQLLTAERLGLTGPALLAARFALTLAIASASYLLLERPIRRRRLLPGRSLRFVAAPVVAAVAVGALVVPAAAGSPRYPRPAPLAAPGPPSSSPAPAPAPAATASPSLRTGPVRVTVLGDSVAETLAQGLASTSGPQGTTIVNRGILGCGIAVGTPYRYFGAVQQQPASCQNWPATWQADVRATRPDVVLVVVGRWEVMDRMHDGQWMHVGQPAYDAYLLAQLATAVRAAHVTGAPVALATAPYYRRGETPSGGLYREDQPARVDRFNALVRQTVAAHPYVHLVDLWAAMDPGGRFTATIGGAIFRYDGVHLSPWGDRYLEPWLLPQLRALAR